MIRISIRKLIDGNRKALAEGTLGALNRQSQCFYEYPNGCRCGIGTAFSNYAIGRLKKKRVNDRGVNRLVSAGLVEFEDFSVAEAIQELHDHWALGFPFQPTCTSNEKMRPLLKAHLNGLRGVDLTRDHYEAFLNILDILYPVTP